MANLVPTIDEIDDAEKLEAYLRTRPVKEAQVIAFRTSVRMMPLLFSSEAKLTKRSCDRIIRVFRSTIISWSSIFFKGLDLNSSPAAVGLRTARHLRPGVGANYLNQTAMAKMAARYAAEAIFANKKSLVAKSVSRAVMMAEKAFGNPNIEAGVILDVVRMDLNGMQAGAIQRVFSSSLWERAGHLHVTEKIEAAFQQRLAELGQDWLNVVWNWYRSFQVGELPYSFLHHRLKPVVTDIVNELDDFWERSPDEIMQDISVRLSSNWREAWDGEDVAIDHVDSQLTQTPAAFRFSHKDDEPINAIPFTDVVSNRDFAETMLSEAIEKAEEFRMRLGQANTDQRIKRSVDRLLAALPQHLDTLNPALLRSKTRSLEANAIAYASAGAEAELFPNAVAELLDLVGTLKDLQGCFPQIAEVERNTVAVDIAGREPEVEIALSEITASARELSANHPSMITMAAVEAVAILDADIVDAPNHDVKRNLLAGSALIKHNFLSAFYRKVLSPAGLEAQRVSKLHYNAAIDGSVEGTKATFSKILPATIAYWFGGPLVAATVVLPDLFKSLKNAKDLTDRLAGEGKDGAKPE